MEVKCPKCGIINTVDDESLTETGIKIPCAGCGVKLVVKKKVKKVSAPPPPPTFHPEPLSSEFTEDEGFYMPDDGLKSSFEPEPKTKNNEEQFFDAGFSLGKEIEETKELSEFILPEEIPDLKFETPKEEKIDEEAIFKEVSQEKPAEEKLPTFDMLTESLFTDEEIIEGSIPVEEPKKAPPPLQPSPIIKKIPLKKTTAVKRETEKRGIGILFITFLFLIGGSAGLYVWKGKEIIGRFFETKNEAVAFDIKIKAQGQMVNAKGERVWYIIGKVRPKNMVVSYIKLKATLYNENGFEEFSREFYAGNILKEEELRYFKPSTVYEFLEREVGDMFSNVNVSPEKGVDFMVVFYNPSPDAEVRFDIVDFQKK